MSCEHVGDAKSVGNLIVKLNQLIDDDLIDENDLWFGCADESLIITDYQGDNERSIEPQ